MLMIHVSVTKKVNLLHLLFRSDVDFLVQSFDSLCILSFILLIKAIKIECLSRPIHATVHDYVQ